MNTYEINQFNEVETYVSGRRDNDTATRRPATELELQLQDELTRTCFCLKLCSDWIELVAPVLEQFADLSEKELGRKHEAQGLRELIDECPIPLEY